MTNPDVRWAVAYQVVAWTALVGIQWVYRSTQAWLLYFALFPQLWAMLRTRWAVVGTVLVVTHSGGALGPVGVSTESLAEILISSVISMVPVLCSGSSSTGSSARRRAAPRPSTSCAPPRPGSRRRSATAGVHEERERISREIHDTLAQRFTSVVALSRAAQAALARGDTATAGERLALIEHTASDNLDEARLIVAELTPGHLQSRTLGEALERLGAAVTSETGLHADVRVAGDPVPLGGSAEVVILRTAQEALSNVRGTRRPPGSTSSWPTTTPTRWC